jgi:hypothetical protein
MESAVSKMPSQKLEWWTKFRILIIVQIYHHHKVSQLKILLCFNFSTVNCVLTNVKFYVHPVAVLGPIFIISLDKGMLSMPDCWGCMKDDDGPLGWRKLIVLYDEFSFTLTKQPNHQTLSYICNKIFNINKCHAFLQLRYTAFFTLC